MSQQEAPRRGEKKKKKPTSLQQRYLEAQQEIARLKDELDFTKEREQEILFIFEQYVFQFFELGLQEKLPIEVQETGFHQSVLERYGYLKENEKKEEQPSSQCQDTFTATQDPSDQSLLPPLEQQLSQISLNSPPLQNDNE